MSHIELGPVVIKDKQLEPEDETSFTIEVKNLNDTFVMKVEKWKLIYSDYFYNQWGVDFELNGFYGKIDPLGTEQVLGKIKTASTKPNSEFPRDFEFKVEIGFCFLPDEEQVFTRQTLISKFTVGKD